MKPKNDRTKSNALVPSKRFRITKLEARIAPHCRGRHAAEHPQECFTAWKCK